MHDDAALRALEARCLALGLRLTAQRRTILGVLAEADDHPDAEQLHQRCAARDRKISLATVYRTIRLLAEAGVIESHQFQDGRMRLDVSSPAHPHLIDRQSGRVIDLPSEPLQRMETELARRFGYRLLSYRLELYGVPLDGPER